jgi:hypothetical protein
MRHGWWVGLLVVAVLQVSAAQAAPGFEVARMVVAGGVEGREPVGVADSFPASTERVYCFVEAVNIAADTQVTLVWSHAGAELLRTELPLKAGSRWRFSAHKTLRGLAGAWKVDLLDATGALVGSAAFTAQ